jgi:hypothetical protein
MVSLRLPAPEAVGGAGSGGGPMLCKTMVPYFDLANHDPAARVAHGFNAKSGMVEVTALGPVAAGSQFCLNYGSQGLANMVKLHGFLPVPRVTTGSTSVLSWDIPAPDDRESDATAPVPMADQRLCGKSIEVDGDYRFTLELYLQNRPSPDGATPKEGTVLDRRVRSIASYAKLWETDAPLGSADTQVQQAQSHHCSVRHHAAVEPGGQDGYALSFQLYHCIPHTGLWLSHWLLFCTEELLPDLEKWLERGQPSKGRTVSLVKSELDSTRRLRLSIAGVLDVANAAADACAHDRSAAMAVALAGSPRRDETEGEYIERVLSVSSDTVQWHDKTIRQLLSDNAAAEAAIPALCTRLRTLGLDSVYGTSLAPAEERLDDLVAALGLDENDSKGGKKGRKTGKGNTKKGPAPSQPATAPSAMSSAATTACSAPNAALAHDSAASHAYRLSLAALMRQAERNVLRSHVVMLGRRMQELTAEERRLGGAA